MMNLQQEPRQFPAKHQEPGYAVQISHQPGLNEHPMVRETLPQIDERPSGLIHHGGCPRLGPLLPRDLFREQPLHPLGYDVDPHQINELTSALHEVVRSLERQSQTQTSNRRRNPEGSHLETGPCILRLNSETSAIEYGDAVLSLRTVKPGTVQWALLRCLAEFPRNEFVPIEAVARTVDLVYAFPQIDKTNANLSFDAEAEQISTFQRARRGRAVEPYATRTSPKKDLDAILRKAVGPRSGRQWSDRWIEWRQTSEGISIRVRATPGTRTK